MKRVNKILILILTGILLACGGFVEDGIEVDYEDSDASLEINPIGQKNGAANDIVSFEILADSDFDIKSCIIKTTIEGKNGSGYNVSDDSYDDPFADHNFGTIRPGIKQFKVRYDYIIPDDANKSRITVILIDESGKVQKETTVEVVPAVRVYNELVVYAKDATFHDAIAASEGMVYQDIKSNYSTFSAENVAIQEKIDIIFYYNPANNNSVIAAPASGRLDLDLNVENSTKFMKIDIAADTDLESLSAGDVERITTEAEISANGSTVVDRVERGDFIAFVADLNAINSLNKGILKVDALHPGAVPRYDGTSYVLKCSIIVQQ
ncbi:hypothetical protein [Portibacter marinus]|uniref:hypothetical protein n=1 Tax=Portibacter marinus TaxID=2898660 RepID=UPI001F1FF1CF|nr:hypothetical protein [Portibacter marinus]